ncbi:hypothetical protein [Photobacterium atrarenae]|uniref:Lipoprotein n=1 Tax=Photobacterium atrarenae TaxID=865757 RepID=A0ABY5GGM6_9GAMM|nr:hypothetical protein [Photobacterium atrarenae]UTV28367.1 hypothetical protein NNL38_03705 [Photobacterium atrarenae]
MNKTSLLALSVVLALAGCTEEDKNDDIKGKALGWGATDSTSFAEIQQRIDAVPALTPKSISQDSGLYVDRSNNILVDCSARPAYTSAHFEIAGENDNIPLADMQRIAAIAEVSLDMIASHLNLAPAALIKHSHFNKLGICLKEGTNSVAGGQGSEISAFQRNTHGGVYEFGLLKHELAHIIDSQMNGNQRGYNINPSWFVEGMAEFITGKQPMALKTWYAKHEKYNNTMLDFTTGNLGGFDDYDLFATAIHYLAEKGWGPGYVEAFFQSDRWHVNSTPTQNGCEGFVGDGVNYTGDCVMSDELETAFATRFDEISAKANGEVTSFAQFQQTYATAIPRWLESR